MSIRSTCLGEDKCTICNPKLLPESRWTYKAIGIAGGYVTASLGTVAVLSTWGHLPGLAVGVILFAAAPILGQRLG
jgi:hypothetical protein